MQNQGSTSNTTVAMSVIAAVLIALGVWWYLGHVPRPGARQTQGAASPPATGQLEGTVR